MSAKVINDLKGIVTEMSKETKPAGSSSLLDADIQMPTEAAFYDAFQNRQPELCLAFFEAVDVLLGGAAALGECTLRQLLFLTEGADQLWDFNHIQ